jgi:hypothetical protein
MLRAKSAILIPQAVHNIATGMKLGYRWLINRFRFHIFMRMPRGLSEIDFSLFSFLKGKKVGLRDRHAVCVCVPSF